jgi:2-oxoglutarate dehydrogenase E2 component (dihydrolipoamide succinyltransferase)
VVMQIETDKTTVGVPAPGSGIIEEIYVADGDTVKSGQQLFKMKITGEAPATKAAPAQAAAAPPPPAAAAPPPPPPKPSAPAAKIPVAAIRHEQANEEATVKLPPVDYSKDMSGTRTEQRVKMNRMRLKIALRLKEAQNTNAMLTTLNEVDMRYD